MSRYQHTKGQIKDNAIEALPVSYTHYSRH